MNPGTKMVLPSLAMKENPNRKVLNANSRIFVGVKGFVYFSLSKNKKGFVYLLAILV